MRYFSGTPDFAAKLILRIAAFGFLLLVGSIPSQAQSALLFPRKASVQAAIHVPITSGEGRLVVGLYQGVPGLDTSVLCKVPGAEVSGASWKGCGEGLPYPLVVTDMLRDTHRAGGSVDRIWLASWGWSGLYYSDDAGQTFFSVQPSFSPDSPGWVAIYSLDQAQDGTIYLGANGGEVYSSSDRGENWRLAGRVSTVSHSTPLEILSHPSVIGTLYARIPGQGVSVSSDFGLTWQVLGGDEINEALLDFDQEIKYDLVLSPGTGRYLFTGSGRGLWRLPLQADGSVAGTWEMMALAGVQSDGSREIPEVVRLTLTTGPAGSAGGDRLVAGTWGHGAFWADNPDGEARLQFSSLALDGQFVGMIIPVPDGNVLIATRAGGIQQVDLFSVSVTSIEDQPRMDLPIVLGQNYPNPFNPETTIRFELPEAAVVRLSVFDLLGREVSRLVDGTVQAGLHEVQFDGSDLPTGVYIYSLKGPTGAIVRSLSLVK